MRWRSGVGILMVAAFLSLSGAALAHEWRGRGPGDRPYGGENPGRPGSAFGQRSGWEGRDKRFETRPEIPQSIQSKIDESRKLADDMRAELRKSPFNRTRVLQLRDRSLRLRREVSDWFFKQRLDEIERAQREQREKKTTAN